MIIILPLMRYKWCCPFSVNEPAVRYDASTGTNSAVTILGGSLQSNKTYQFVVIMDAIGNVTRQGTGYVLVKVEETRPIMIAVG